MACTSPWRTQAASLATLMWTWLAWLQPSSRLRPRSMGCAKPWWIGYVGITTMASWTRTNSVKEGMTWHCSWGYSALRPVAIRRVLSHRCPIFIRFQVQLHCKLLACTYYCTLATCLTTRLLCKLLACCTYYCTLATCLTTRLHCKLLACCTYSLHTCHSILTYCSW